MDIDNAPSSADEYPLKFLYPIASLKYLAVTNLALDLWHHNQLGHFRMKISTYDEANFECEQVLRILLPEPIKKMIDVRIYSMGRELKAIYNSFEILKIVQDNQDFLKFYDCLTYGPDGRMSSERSARNLLTRRELTSMKKFGIACVFWFEDEIKQMWPSVSDLEEKSNFGTILNSFVTYWINKLRDNPEYYSMNPICLGLIKYDHMTKEVGNWTANLHLLNTIPTEKQCSSISFYTYISESRYALSKLNRVQVDYLLSYSSENIIIDLAFDEGCVEYALRIWDQVRNSITYKRFCYILEALYFFLDQSMRPKHEGVKNEMKQALDVFSELLITAPNRMKTENFYGFVDGIFCSLSDYFSVVYQHPHNYIMNFFSELFSDMPTELRFSMWHNHWQNMVYRCSIELLNDLLKLCLNNQRLIERFVEENMLNLSKVKNIMSAWFTEKLYNRMINYEKLCTWNEDLVREFRKQIFTSCISSHKCFDLDDLIELGEVIDNSLSNVDEARDLKRTILYTKEVRKLFGILMKESAKEAISVIEHFSPTKRSLLEKHLLLGYWRHFFNFKYKRNENFDSRRWVEFLHWWVDHEDNVPRFKKSLPVNEIFEKLLMRSVSNLSSRLGSLNRKVSEPVPLSIKKLEEFANADHFLMWYFGNEKTVRNYKTNTISNYRKMAKLYNLLSANNECIVNNILAWFFNYNNGDVRRFKKYFKKNVRVV